MIYFVEAGVTGAIKIGYTTMFVVDRLMFLQVGNAEHLRIMAFIHGNRKNERMLHDQFKQHRLRGEWFARHDDIVQHIRSLQSQPIVLRELSYYRDQLAEDLVNPEFYRLADGVRPRMMIDLEPWQLRPDIYAPPASPWAELSTSKGTTK